MSRRYNASLTFDRTNENPRRDPMAPGHTRGRFKRIARRRHQGMRASWRSNTRRRLTD